MEQTEQQTKEFRVEHYGGTHTVQGRQAAVKMAKRISNERRGRVRVEREDGAVRMQFHSGSLETLVAETPDRRRRRRRQGR